MSKSKQMIRQQDWDKFRQTGLLWLVNNFLHVFGWALVMEYDDNKVVGAYPARVTFRGFSQEAEEQGRARLAKYMRDNATELYEEVKYEKIKDY